MLSSSETKWFGLRVETRIERGDFEDYNAENWFFFSELLPQTTEISKLFFQKPSSFYRVLYPLISYTIGFDEWFCKQVNETFLQNSIPYATALQVTSSDSHFKTREPL